MKYLITADQKVYFDNHNTIEFENLLSEKELATLQRLKTTSLRDISRGKPEIQKIILASRFAQIAAELTSKKRLRFGYDQVYELPMNAPSHLKTLQEISTISPLACAFTICLEGESGKIPNNQDIYSFDPFAQKPGNVTFFLPSCPWDFEALSQRVKQKFLLVTYADPRALYIYQEQDPYTHTLKQFGYVFGDRLNEKWHPMLFR
jgi:hypothetical protein